MRKLYTKYVVALVLVTLSFSIESTAQLNELPRGSQIAKVFQRIGITDITVIYSRPSVNDREIWGKLVPYGMNNLGFGTAKESPWRAGANENTIIKFTSDVKIEGKDLPAGKYGLHMIVNENNTATIIFSENNTAWGSYFYEPSEDVLRVDVSTKEVTHTEQLTFEFNEVNGTSGVVALNWGEKQIPFKVDIDVANIVLVDIRQKLQASPGFNRQTWEQAANYSQNNGGDLDEALFWVNNAIGGKFYSQKNFSNLSIKAQILTKQGKTTEASTIMDDALDMGTIFQIHGYGRQLIGQGQEEKALEVFKKNAKMNKGAWPVDYGLARGYSAVGNYKTALKHIKIAAKRAPDQINKDAIVANIVKLESGTDIN